MQRKASAVWKGGLKDGKGTISAPGGALNNTQYSFTTRFENAPGTNPEELVAAAHAGCFSMALSAQLGNRNNGLSLASLEATLGLIDHVNAALAAHDTIVAVTPAQRFQ